MRIAELRKAAGKTQDQLAREMGVSRSSVAMWEVGAISPATEKLPQLADILGRSIDELFRAKVNPCHRCVQFRKTEVSK